MARSVLIIGGGVIGLCTAYYAARRGLRVTVLDREPAAHEGCSYGNAGMIVPSHFVPLAAPGMVALGLKWMWNPESPFYIQPRLDADLLDWAWKFWRAANAEQVRRAAPLLRDLSFASRACFEELAAGAPVSDPALSERTPAHAGPEAGAPRAGGLGDFGLVKRGLLMLCKTPHGFEEEAKFAAQSNALGVPAQVLDAKQAAALDPAVRMDVAGAVYFPQDCHLSPQRFMAALKAQCVALGVELRWEHEVTRVTRHGNRITAVQTKAGEFTAEEVVICGGSWSPLVAREVGLALPMQAGKGYSLTLPQPRQLPTICSIFTEARLAVTPMGASLRIGGTMELAGLNEQINPRRVQGIIKAVPHYFPEFTVRDFDGVRPWCGLRPCSPDGLPYVGRTARFANLSLATGHAMMGLSLGPITGKLMAELLVGEAPAINVAALSPDRYA